MRHAIIRKLKGGLDQTYLRFRMYNHYSKSRRFIQKVSVDVDSSRYRVKTVSSLSELHLVLRLRYDVFIKEQLKQRKLSQLDVDRYDFMCDHLIVIEKETSRVVGTYRLISSLFSDEFYSESEFDLGSIHELEGNKLEMGRACIHRDHRRGIVIALLWRGLVQYMDRTHTRYLFGCSSVKTTKTEQIARLYRHLQLKGHTREGFNVRPSAEFEVPEFHEALEQLEQEPITVEGEREISEMIPPLLRSYLKAGAAVVGDPALDRAFRCADFLTLFDREQVDQSYKRHFSA